MEMKETAYNEFCDSIQGVIRSLRKLVEACGLDPNEFRVDIMHLALFKTTIEYKLSKGNEE